MTKVEFINTCPCCTCPYCGVLHTVLCPNGLTIDYFRGGY